MAGPSHLTLNRYQVLNAVTASGAFGIFPTSVNGQYVELTMYVVFDATAAAGVVVLETADNVDYAGTWANIGTVTFSAASKQHYVSVTGTFLAIRARVSSAVTSGTVSAYVVASN